MPLRSAGAHDAEYDEFVAASWRRLCWTAYMLIGDRQLAEDLAQTALVKTYVVWPRVRRDDAFAYARRVLVNANIDRLRRRHLTEVPGLVVEPAARPVSGRRGPAWPGLAGRRNRRLARIGAVAAVVAVAVGGWLVTERLRDDAAPPRPAKPDSTKVLSAYERRVLAEVPGSYAVGGEVVVPAPIDPRGTWSLGHQVDDFTGRLAPLGWHSMSPLSDGLLPSTVDTPGFMHTRPPDGTDGYQDSGPMRIGCRLVTGARCGLIYVLGDRDIGWFTGYRLGDTDFLKPGKPMQLIPGGTLENNRLQPTVVGGMHGSTAAKVALTLRDGTVARAVVDSPPVRATAYDRAGRVVEDHEVTPCDDPVDCNTR